MRGNDKHPLDPRDVMHKVSNILPVFTAKEIRTGATELLSSEAIAFIVHDDCDYQIDGAGVAAPLTAGNSVRGMPVGATKVTFNVPVTVEIM